MDLANEQKEVLAVPRLLEIRIGSRETLAKAPAIRGGYCATRLRGEFQSAQHGLSGGTARAGLDR